MGRAQYDTTLPDKGVVFLGGHPSVVTKLKKIYPKWKYINDVDLKRHRPDIRNDNIVFFWNRYGSHTIMQYAFKRLPKDAEILYVTSTSIPLLVKEMSDVYSSSSILN